MLTVIFSLLSTSAIPTPVSRHRLYHPATIPWDVELNSPTDLSILVAVLESNSARRDVGRDLVSPARPRRSSGRIAWTRTCSPWEVRSPRTRRAPIQRAIVIHRLTVRAGRRARCELGVSLRRSFPERLQPAGSGYFRSVVAIPEAHPAPLPIPPNLPTRNRRGGSLVSPVRSAVRVAARGSYHAVELGGLMAPTRPRSLMMSPGIRVLSTFPARMSKVGESGPIS